ncbi:hypothetical protein [Aliikangiella sp. IMCC44359]|uniref:hypothetical protein n=1 Tax=Aliikangiella sp. IMCC44359 TaxID=3459125 RepID=UPI00403AF150
MDTKPSYGNSIADANWGVEHHEVEANIADCKVKLCHVKVKDLKKLAFELTRVVQTKSWIYKLDTATQRSYIKTAKDTAQDLIEIFNRLNPSGKVSGEFGELMVSIGSSRALEMIFTHDPLPISELWKPQKKQNEGFDFHTVCPEDLINYGEAKYSTKETPHGEAIGQARGFIDEEKHFRDRVHLINLVKEEAIQNLDDDKYGVVAAFSLHAVNPLKVLHNALKSAEQKFNLKTIKKVYLIGVTH